TRGPVGSDVPDRQFSQERLSLFWPQVPRKAELVPEHRALRSQVARGSVGWTSLLSEMTCRASCLIRAGRKPLRCEIHPDQRKQVTIRSSCLGVGWLLAFGELRRYRRYCRYGRYCRQSVRADLVRNRASLRIPNQMPCCVLQESSPLVRRTTVVCPSQ